MYNRLDLSKTLFIDIETVPEMPAFTELDADWRGHWQDKWKKTRAMRYRHVFDRDMPDAADTDLTSEAEFAYREAGLYAEFGKICCITVGYFKEYHGLSGQRHFHVASIYGPDELQVLDLFSRSLETKKERTGHGTRNERFCWNICGHNVREFDIPYLCRRLLVNGLPMPDLIDCAGLKPWEIPHVVDTMELWKFGDIKSYTGLNLLASRFNIPSPKDEMSGAGVYDAYLAGEFDKIGVYCGKDVLTVAQLVLRWRNEELLTDDEVQTQMRFLPAKALVTV